MTNAELCSIKMFITNTDILTCQSDYDLKEEVLKIVNRELELKRLERKIPESDRFDVKGRRIDE